MSSPLAKPSKSVPWCPSGVPISHGPRKRQRATKTSRRKLFGRARWAFCICSLCPGRSRNRNRSRVYLVPKVYQTRRIFGEMEAPRSMNRRCSMRKRRMRHADRIMLAQFGSCTSEPELCDAGTKRSNFPATGLAIL